MRWGVAAAVVGLWVAVAAAAAVRPAVGVQAVGAPSGREVEEGVGAVGSPALHLVFDEAIDGVRSVAFSPDGGTLYVHYEVGAIDVWPIVVFYWPEWVGALVALGTVAALWCVVRVSRRPQVKGAPHCRACNYDLSAHAGVRGAGERGGFEGAAGAKCPECGVGLDVRRPRRGRGMARRLAPAVGAWVVLVGAYAGVWAAAWASGGVREGAASRWVSLPSTALADYAEARSIGWMRRLKQPCDRVVAVDPRTGERVRVVTTRASRTFTNLCVSPDGGSLFLTDGDRTVVRIGVESGREKGRFVAPGAVTVNVRADAVIGFSGDGGTAYVQWVDRDGAVSGVSAWAMGTGASETLVRETAYSSESAPGRRFPYGRLFRVLDGEGKRVLSWPQFMESYGTKTFVLRVHEAGEVRAFSPRPLPGWDADPVVTSDGKVAFFSKGAGVGGAILGVDLERGEMIGVLRSAWMDTIGEDLALSADGRLLAAAGMTGGVFVRDVEAKRWVARLRVPEGLYAPRLAFSPDGRWLAAVCQKGQQGAFTHEVVLWEVGGEGWETGGEE